MLLKVIIRKDDVKCTGKALLQRFRINEQGDREALPDPVEILPGHDLEVHVTDGIGFEITATENRDCTESEAADEGDLLPEQGND